MTALVHAGLNGVAPIMAGLPADDAWLIRNLLAGGIALAVVMLGGFRAGRASALPRLLAANASEPS
jgi:hypothetical protein